MKIIQNFGLIVTALKTLGFTPEKFTIVNAEGGESMFYVYIENPLLFDRVEFCRIAEIEESKVHIPELIRLNDSNEFVTNDHYITIKL